MTNYEQQLDDLRKRVQQLSEELTKAHQAYDFERARYWDEQPIWLETRKRNIELTEENENLKETLTNWMKK